LYKIPANTLFMGNNVVFVPECHSTNTLAHELTRSASLSEGTVIITEHQTAGRGQRGSAWEAEPGKNLTFTLTLKPTFLALKDQFFLNIFTSLSIHDLLRDKINAMVSIKWPNDILIGGKKLCGILVENQIQGLQVSNSFIGIGLNVNQKEFQVPSATSIYNQTNKTCELQVLLGELLEKMEARFFQLREGKLDLLMQDYLSRLYWLGEKHLFRSNGTEFEGQITGIDSSGKLKIQTRQAENSFDIKEIKFVQ
jgi:BirA family transcriptional regulator, biotin operon repressor / biotin---[acetyl-CoA-carboxylase] ligase